MALDPQLKLKHKKSLRVIRNVYLYLVAMIGLVVMIFGAVGCINNVFQNYVFHVNDSYLNEPISPGMRGGTCNQSYIDPTDTENKRMIVPTTQEVAECKTAQKEQQDQNQRNNIGREFSISIAQMLVGLPIWLFHWGIIQREYKRKEEKES